MKKYVSGLSLGLIFRYSRTLIEVWSDWQTLNTPVRKLRGYFIGVNSCVLLCPAVPGIWNKFPPTN